MLGRYPAITCTSEIHRCPICNGFARYAIVKVPSFTRGTLLRLRCGQMVVDLTYPHRLDFLRRLAGQRCRAVRKPPRFAQPAEAC